MLTAEIIAVGSELLTPERSDTNSLWLTSQLDSVGVEVKLKTIVGDDPARLRESFADAFKRSDIVISTGGLGPTEDDVTRQAAADAIDRELIYQTHIEQHLRERFRQWGREMPEINKRQAFLIDGAEELPNANGSAPGQMIELDGRLLVLLPGPPRELKPIFTERVMPRIAGRSGGVSVRRRMLRVSGMGESAVDEIIAPVYSRFPDVATTILFNRSEIQVHFTARNSDADAAQQAVDRVAEEVAEALGPAVFSVNGDEIEVVVGNLLTAAGRTLATAESCTGGVLAARLTDIPGSSAYFVEGFVTYANSAKICELGVPDEMIASNGAVSAPVAEAMARGIRKRAGTDIGIGITGIAGPDGGTDDKPVGTVFICVYDENGPFTRRFSLPGDRELVRWRSSHAALDMLRRRAAEPA